VHARIRVDKMVEVKEEEVKDEDVSMLNLDTTLDEDSTDEQPEKEHTSGDDGTADEQQQRRTADEQRRNADEQRKTSKRVAIREDEEEEEEDDHREKDESEDETESEYSESEESDSLDEGEAEDRRKRYVMDMNDLEKQFADLKEQLYKEKLTQIDDQLGKVNQSMKMEAKEYIGPLKQLEQDCEIRTEVAGYLKHYKIINVENQLQCELQSAEQHFQNEENAIISQLMLEFEEKLRKVEEERHTAEMYSDLWCDDAFRSRKKRKGMEIFVPDKRKKPVTVTGPYIIYMLNEMDILEDWAAIRKAKSELARRKASELSSDKEDPYVTARYEDGKFFYQGQWFQKGEKVVLDNRIDFPVNATITAINTGEVWVSKRDGVKCKLYIAQFQKGKYVMRRADHMS